MAIQKFSDSIIADSVKSELCMDFSECAPTRVHYECNLVGLGMQINLRG